jgi:hypothetical protein
MFCGTETGRVIFGKRRRDFHKTALIWGMALISAGWRPRVTMVYGGDAAKLGFRWRVSSQDAKSRTQCWRDLEV